MLLAAIAAVATGLFGSIALAARTRNQLLFAAVMAELGKREAVAAEGATQDASARSKRRCASLLSAQRAEIPTCRCG
jgi:hypothetical protein